MPWLYRWPNRPNGIYLTGKESLVLRILIKILTPIGAALATSAGVFALSAASPHNPLASTVSNWEFMSDQTRADMAAAYDSGGWLGAWSHWVYTSLASADLGYSRILHAPVGEIIATRGLNTLATTVMAAGLTAVITLTLCLPLAIYPRLASRAWLTSVLGLWLGMPVFLVAVLVVVLLGQHLYNPALTAPIVMAPSVAAIIAFAWSAYLMAAARTAAHEIWATPWARALIGRGIAKRLIIRCILPRLLAAVGAYALLMVPELVIGSAVVEAVLAYPGLGNALVKAAAGADLPLLATATALAALITATLIMLRGARPASLS